MIRVVNVRGLNSREQRAGIVYVGRRFAGWPGHALGNPFFPTRDRPVGTCLNLYRDWLLARPTLDADLAALWEATEQGARPLGCWCVEAVLGDKKDTVCHAQVLAALFGMKFLCGGEGENVASSKVG